MAIGYDVHIHRGQDWVELTPDEHISLEAWQTFVALEPDFRLDGFAEARVQGDDGEFYDEGAAAPDTPFEKPSGFLGRLFGRG